MVAASGEDRKVKRTCYCCGENVDWLISLGPFFHKCNASPTCGTCSGKHLTQFHDLAMRVRDLRSVAIAKGSAEVEK